MKPKQFLRYFVGGHYEVLSPGSGQIVTKSYFAGASRIAMRKYTIPASMTVEYFLGDHLGSTSVTTDNAGVKVSEMRYKPWGEVRYSWTSSQSTTPAYTLPKYTFTGQYSYMDDPSTQGAEGFGLMFYNARWYDPLTGRMIQADSIVPNDMQGLDRYLYTANNPVRYTDPSGHDWTDCGNRVRTRCEIHMRKVKQAFERWWLEEAQSLLLIIQNALDNPNDTSAIEAASAALGDLAELLGIHLPSGYWSYNNIIWFELEGGVVSVNGFNPVVGGGSFWGSDSISKFLVAIDDSGVYISGDLFRGCGMNLNCVAGVMFEEAGHAWLEHLSPTPNSLSPTGVYENEEILLESMAVSRFGDPAGVMAYNIKKHEASCVNFGYSCENPLKWVAPFYGFNSDSLGFYNYLWSLILGGE